jgi:hypothetical protein
MVRYSPQAMHSASVRIAAFLAPICTGEVQKCQTAGIMKKPKHEAELFKAALQAGIRYAEGRGAVEFEPTDSASDKALYVYRLLVHDKIITPMPEEQVAEKSVRHRLALWYAHQLPKGHPLLGA